MRQDDARDILRDASAGLVKLMIVRSLGHTDARYKLEVVPDEFTQGVVVMNRDIESTTTSEACAVVIEVIREILPSGERCGRAYVVIWLLIRNLHQQILRPVAVLRHARLTEGREILGHSKSPGCTGLPGVEAGRTAEYHMQAPGD